MPLRGQIGGVAIPVEQIERGIILAQQIIVGDVIPDQVAPAQLVEHRRHIAPVEKAVGGQRLEQFELIVGDEIQQFPRFLEIDLRGEEGRALDRVRFPARCQHCERRSERRARHAIADGVHRRHLQRASHGFDRVDLRGDIIVPHHILHAGVGRSPRDHEHGDALFDRPANEAFLRRQVENVEAVDPGREDHQRHRQHIGGGRGILDQLVEIGAVDHLARRRRQITPHFERGLVGMRHLPLGEIGEHILQALEQVFAAGLDRLFEHFGVGRGEIGRADRIQKTARGKAHLLALLVVDALQRVDLSEQLVREQEVALANPGE